MKIIAAPLPAMPWQERPNDCADILWRYSGNPIITRHHVPNAHTISNSAAVPFGSGYAGVFRCDTNRFESEVHVGFSPDGIHWDIAPDKIDFEMESPELGTSLTHYDPRITELDGKYYVVFCNDYFGPTLGIAVTEDFKTFRKLEHPLLTANRNGVLFPRKVNGMYLLLSRPSDMGHTLFGDIFVSQSPDLRFWGEHRHVFGTANGWQSVKVGAGPCPIETTAGWLLFYHGVGQTCSGLNYNIGAALLDLNEPWKVIARSSRYLLAPEAIYETAGYVPNVCFPVAALADAGSGRIALYYGCADTSVGLCFGMVDEIIDFIRM